MEKSVSEPGGGGRKEAGKIGKGLPGKQERVRRAEDISSKLEKRV